VDVDISRIEIVKRDADGRMIETLVLNGAGEVIERIVHGTD